MFTDIISTKKGEKKLFSFKNLQFWEISEFLKKPVSDHSQGNNK